jgi:hypothetical protein
MIHGWLRDHSEHVDRRRMVSTVAAQRQPSAAKVDLFGSSAYSAEQNPRTARVDTNASWFFGAPNGWRFCCRKPLVTVRLAMAEGAQTGRDPLR